LRRKRIGVLGAWALLYPLKSGKKTQKLRESNRFNPLQVQLTREKNFEQGDKWETRGKKQEKDRHQGTGFWFRALINKGAVN